MAEYLKQNPEQDLGEPDDQGGQLQVPGQGKNTKYSKYQFAITNNKYTTLNTNFANTNTKYTAKDQIYFRKFQISPC